MSVKGNCVANNGPLHKKVKMNGLAKLGMRPAVGIRFNIGRLVMARQVKSGPFYLGNILKVG